MPDKTNVSVGIRIRRPDGKMDRLTASGGLYRMSTAWTVICRVAEPSTGSPAEGGITEMTVIVRESEIRMKRKGPVGQDQIFRIGQRKPGTIATSVGILPAEASTHRIQSDLSPSGGTVEWEYNFQVMGEELGRFTITLDIREEQTE